MKKETKKAGKLELARETLVNLDDRQLQPVVGGCFPFTGAHCCPDVPTYTCDP